MLKIIKNNTQYKNSTLRFIFSRKLNKDALEFKNMFGDNLEFFYGTTEDWIRFQHKNGIPLTYHASRKIGVEPIKNKTKYISDNGISEFHKYYMKAGTCQKIAEDLGISRQRAHQLIKGEYKFGSRYSNQYVTLLSGKYGI